jgi:hypothetical protein
MKPIPRHQTLLNRSGKPIDSHPNQMLGIGVNGFEKVKRSQHGRDVDLSFNGTAATAEKCPAVNT